MGYLNTKKNQMESGKNQMNLNYSFDTKIIPKMNKKLVKCILLESFTVILCNASYHY